MGQAVPGKAGIETACSVYDYSLTIAFLSHRAQSTAAIFTVGMCAAVHVPFRHIHPLGARWYAFARCRAGCYSFPLCFLLSEVDAMAYSGITIISSPNREKKSIGIQSLAFGNKFTLRLTTGEAYNINLHVQHSNLGGPLSTIDESKARRNEEKTFRFGHTHEAVQKIRNEQWTDRILPIMTKRPFP